MQRQPPLALDTCDLPSAGGSRPGRQKGLGWAEPASEASEPAVTQQASARSRRDHFPVLTFHSLNRFSELGECHVWQLPVTTEDA